jgi:excisionase family DNA binding protein
MSGKEIETGRQDLPKLLYPRDVAQVLGISIKTIHKLVRDGKLGCVKVTERDRRFSKEQVQYYIEGCTKNAPAKIDREPSVRVDTPRVRQVSSPPKKGGGDSVRFSRRTLKEEMRQWH